MHYALRIKKFLYSQYFYGGLRIACGISLPAALMLTVFHERALGFAIAAGVHADWQSCGAGDRSGRVSAADFVADSGAARIYGVNARCVRCQMAAHQFRGADDDGDNAQSNPDFQAGVDQRPLPVGRRSLVYMLERCGEPLAGGANGTAGDWREYCRGCWIFTGGRAPLRLQK